MFRPSHSPSGMTLVESLTVIVILGIVLFITLPHLTQSKEANDVAAMKSKAMQLNFAKNAYISFVGLDVANAQWANPPAPFPVHTPPNNLTEARYEMIAQYLPQGVKTKALTIGAYTVPGFSLSFTQGGARILVTAPVVITLTGGAAIPY